MIGVGDYPFVEGGRPSYFYNVIYVGVHRETRGGGMFFHTVVTAYLLACAVILHAHLPAPDDMI